jgi:hypothetical protein
VQTDVICQLFQLDKAILCDAADDQNDRPYEVKPPLNPQQVRLARRLVHYQAISALLDAEEDVDGQMELDGLNVPHN